MHLPLQCLPLDFHQQVIDCLMGVRRHANPLALGQQIDDGMSGQKRLPRPGGALHQQVAVLQAMAELAASSRSAPSGTIGEPASKPSMRGGSRFKIALTARYSSWSA